MNHLTQLRAGVKNKGRMMYVFQIHWKLRKGLGPGWEDRVSEIGLDDLPPETTHDEAKAIAISDFRIERYRHGTTEREYLITDVCSS